jgi:uncharacterized circularly permuted ATP-grasp superfamily protein
VDPISQRAADDYHRLLQDETGLAQELEQRFLERMREARLTFGGRVLCSFPRPDFVSPADYAQIQGVCRGNFRAVEKVEAALGRDLWDRVDLAPEERELAALDPGYRRSSPTSRLDSFLTRSAYQFVELNAESPAGIAYNEVLAEVFLELPVMKAFRERWSVRRFRGRERLLETLLRCYREAGGRSERPVIAVVDYEDVPTRVEHHLFREFFESRGYPALVCDPRQLSFENGRLRHGSAEIDIVYRRLLVNEFLERASELQALAEAVKRRAVVMVNPFRCKPLHKKAIFAVLTDDGLQHLFTPEERSAIATHVPWTRRLRDGRSTRQGAEIDLPEFVRANRERLVMKPNDEYGGKGVFLGWEMSQADWEAALASALQSSYVVQEKVDLMRLGFPAFSAEGRLGIRELVVDLDPFLFDGEVEGFLTRLSGSSLANVTSGGGQVPGFLVTPRNE